MATNMELRCGVGNCNPKWMRRFATINWFTGFYSVSGLMTSSLSVYIASQITTIERQFGLSSTKSGYLMACNDIGFSLFVLIAGYLASRVNVPRFLGYSAILYGISGILCSMPHFIASSNNFLTLQTQTVTETAFSNSTNSTESDAVPPDPKVYVIQNASFVLIAVGMVLQGVAKAARQPMLSQFLDDNTKKEDTGMYMGIILACAIFGPAIAFGLGGYFSQIYVTLEDVGLHPRDPRWVGAWWLGFLSFGVAAIIFATPLLFFPRSLSLDPQEEEERLEKLIDGLESRTHNRRTRCGCFGRELKGIVRSVGFVLRSPVYVLCLLGTIVNVLGMSSGMAFIPKYMEISFNVPTWKANVLLAAVGIVSTSIGSFLGGWLTKKFKLNPPRCIMLILATQIPTVISGFITMFIYCDQPIITHAPTGLGPGFVSSRFCNDTCEVPGSPYMPVCGSDGANYFSPCHAGCPDIPGQITRTLTNCTCVPGGEATPGLCDFDCNMLLPFCIVAFVTSVVSASMMVPVFILLLRSVPNEVKSMGVGISSLSMSLLAMIPGPVIGGKLIDSTCLWWSVRGSCSLYDITSLRYNLFGLNIACRCAAILIYTVGLACSWKMTKWPSEVTKRHKAVKPGSDILMKKYKFKD